VEFSSEGEVTFKISNLFSIFAPGFIKNKEQGKDSLFDDAF
jgi:hypothetical protein